MMMTLLAAKPKLVMEKSKAAAATPRISPAMDIS
jgi:hypothetical protein